jgi:hypothetical protein
LITNNNENTFVQVKENENMNKLLQHTGTVLLGAGITAGTIVGIESVASAVGHQEVKAALPAPDYLTPYMSVAQVCIKGAVDVTVNVSQGMYPSQPADGVIDNTFNNPVQITAKSNGSGSFDFNPVTSNSDHAVGVSSLDNGNGITARGGKINFHTIVCDPTQTTPSTTKITNSTPSSTWGSTESSTGKSTETTSTTSTGETITTSFSKTPTSETTKTNTTSPTGETTATSETTKSSTSTSETTTSTATSITNGTTTAVSTTSTRNTVTGETSTSSTKSVTPPATTNKTTGETTSVTTIESSTTSNGQTTTTHEVSSSVTNPATGEVETTNVITVTSPNGKVSAPVTNVLVGPGKAGDQLTNYSGEGNYFGPALAIGGLLVLFGVGGSGALIARRKKGVHQK